MSEAVLKRAATDLLTIIAAPGLTGQQKLILIVLAFYPEGLTVSQIAAALGGSRTDRPTLSRAMRYPIAKGIIHTKYTERRVDGLGRGYRAACYFVATK